MPDGDSLLDPFEDPRYGVTKEQGLDMISAAAKDAEQRQQAGKAASGGGVSDEEINKMVEEMLEKGTPLPGNKCKASGCNGNVVRQCTGMIRGQLLYSSPHCEKCGCSYFYAENAPGVGAEEFLKSLRNPMTI